MIEYGLALAPITGVDHPAAIIPDRSHFDSVLTAAHANTVTRGLAQGLQRNLMACHVEYQIETPPRLKALRCARVRWDDTKDLGPRMMKTVAAVGIPGLSTRSDTKTATIQSAVRVK